MEFQDQICAEHLAGMCHYATISNEDPSQMDFSPFAAFQSYLKATYPLVHKTLTQEIVGDAGLLYFWKGTGESSALPVLLAAHQDVVPVGNEADWKYPPFSAVAAEGYLWGRGVSDCKCIIMAHMEALEALISEGFRPRFDIYLAYGYNEECATDQDNSAKKICRLLQERGVTLGCVIDEGHGSSSGKSENIKSRIANVMIAEKGYADVEFSISDQGGHSMYAANTGIVAKLGRLAARLEESPYPYRWTDAVRQELSLKAPHMGELGRLFDNQNEVSQELAAFLDQNPHIGCKFHTTVAQTMLSGSPQANVLPTKVSLVVNCRLLEGDTLDSLMARCREIAGDGIEVRLIKGREPSDVSRIDTDAYACIKEVTEELNPGTLVAPILVAGGTDARNYTPICESVYRYSGYPCNGDENAHTYNEKILLSVLHKGPEFIYHLIKKYNLL